MSTEYGDFDHSGGSTFGTLTVSQQFGELNLWLDFKGREGRPVYNFRMNAEDLDRFIGAILSVQAHIEEDK